MHLLWLFVPCPQSPTRLCLDLSEVQKGLEMDQKFIELAKVELGEDESKREESLTKFRDWLETQPHLEGVRKGR